MFKDDYKKANDSLKPDEKIINAISAGISESAPTSAGKIKKFPISKLVAAVAGICMIIGVAFASPFIMLNKAWLKEENKSSAISMPPLTTSIKEETASDVEIIEDAPPQEEESEAKPVSSQETQSKQPNYSSTTSTSSIEENQVNWKEIVDPKYHKLYSIFNKHVKQIKLESELDSSDRAQNIVAANKGTSPASKPTSGKLDYSETNNQVKEVDEADIIKTDGEYIYRIREVDSYNERFNFTIYKANGKKTKQISDFRIKPTDWEDDFYAEEMFLKDDKAFIIGTIYHTGFKSETGIITYDVSNPRNPKRLSFMRQLGGYSSSRLLGDVIYVISKESRYEEIDPAQKKDFLPYCYNGQKIAFFDIKDIYFAKNPEINYAVICSYSAKTSERIDKIAILGGGNVVYMNTEYLVCGAESYYSWDSFGDYRNKTILNLFKISEKGKIKHLANTSFKGYIHNQFSMDIYKDHLRLVATVTDKKNTTTNSLLIFDKNLKITGKIEGLAKDERIYSARFQEDIAYFVTYRETDPLFCADVSNPKKPKILSALKIPGFSTYLHPYGEGLLFGFGEYEDIEGLEDSNLKLSMFDTSDLKDVKEAAMKLICNTESYENPNSDALYDHKAIFVSPKKNIIGFAYYAWSAKRDSTRKKWYAFYKYTDKGFELIKNIPLSKDYYDARGLYIGNNFYISTSQDLTVVDMKTWEEVATIK